MTPVEAMAADALLDRRLKINPRGCSGSSGARRYPSG